MYVHSRCSTFVLTKGPEDCNIKALFIYIQEKRRAEVEKRLEEKQEDEKIKLRHARAALWEERREKQRLLRQLEIKMKMVKAVSRIFSDSHSSFS